MKLRSDWDFVFCALYHERERTEEMAARTPAMTLHTFYERE